MDVEPKSRLLVFVMPPAVIIAFLIAQVICSSILRGFAGPPSANLASASLKSRPRDPLQEIKQGTWWKCSFFRLRECLGFPCLEAMQKNAFGRVEKSGELDGTTSTSFLLENLSLQMSSTLDCLFLHWFVMPGQRGIAFGFEAKMH
jgi:hypothetical protein